MPVETLLPYQPDTSDAMVEVYHPVLKEFLRAAVEQLDGFYLDNEADREALVPLLATTLIRATQSGELVLVPFPPESVPLPETSGSSSPVTPAT